MHSIIPLSKQGAHACMPTNQTVGNTSFMYTNQLGGDSTRKHKVPFKAKNTTPVTHLARQIYE